METMMGYIQKDEGAQHYKLETLGYTSAQLLKSKEAHQSVRVSHESDKIMINKIEPDQDHVRNGVAAVASCCCCCELLLLRPQQMVLGRCHSCWGSCYY